MCVYLHMFAQDVLSFLSCPPGPWIPWLSIFQWDEPGSRERFEKNTRAWMWFQNQTKFPQCHHTCFSQVKDATILNFLSLEITERTILSFEDRTGRNFLHRWNSEELVSVHLTTRGRYFMYGEIFTRLSSGVRNAWPKGDVWEHEVCECSPILVWKRISPSRNKIKKGKNRDYYLTCLT